MSWMWVSNPALPPWSLYHYTFPLILSCILNFFIRTSVEHISSLFFIDKFYTSSFKYVTSVCFSMCYVTSSMCYVLVTSNSSMSSFCFYGTSVFYFFVFLIFVTILYFSIHCFYCTHLYQISINIKLYQISNQWSS